MWNKSNNSRKDKYKLEKLKLTDDQKKILKKRIKIEHINAQLKKYKRIAIRYDKYTSNYCLYLHLACIDIILNYAYK